MAKLKEVLNQTNAASPRALSRLVLGTVQFGLGYGATNKSGMPSLEAVGAMLRQADDLGIAALDTARAYGESERRIGIVARSWGAREPEGGPGSGFPFQVITKLDPLTAQDSSDASGLRHAVRHSLERSAEELGDHAAPKCVLLHRPAQRTAASGLIWEELKAWRAAEGGRTIGVSLSSPDELIECLEDMSVQHVQLPYNCLDHRWESAPVQKALAGRKDVVVHVRSVLLQGLLATNDEADLLKVFDQRQARRVGAFMDLVQSATGAASRAEAAISFVSAVDWISGLVIGVTSQRELGEVAAAFGLRVAPSVLETLRGQRPVLDEAELNPAMWRKL